MMHLRQSQKGMSMVELLVAAGISASILAVSVAALSNMTAAWSRDTVRSVQNRQARTSIEAMATVVKAGTNIAVDPNGTSFMVTESDGRQITFALVGTSLVYVDSSIAASRDLADNVTAFAISDVLDGAVTIGVDLTLTIGPIPPGITTSTRVLLPGW